MAEHSEAERSKGRFVDGLLQFCLPIFRRIGLRLPLLLPRPSGKGWTCELVMCVSVPGVDMASGDGLYTHCWTEDSREQGVDCVRELHCFVQGLKGKQKCIHYSFTRSDQPR